MKLSLLNEVDITRRNFLKGTSAALSGNPSKVAAAVAGTGIPGHDPYSDVSDEELMNTPEQEWMNKIPYSRLKRIIGDNPSYVQFELPQKILLMVRYGFDYRDAKYVSSLFAKTLRDMNKSVPVDSIIQQARYDYSPSIHDNIKQVVQKAKGLADKYLKATSEAGIELPAGRVNNEFVKYGKQTHKDALNWYERKKELRKRQARFERKKHLDQYDVPSDYEYASSMHQPFESKLNRALFNI